MTENTQKIDPDSATVPAIAAVYETLRAAVNVIQAGKNDGRANDVTERWLDRIAGNLDCEIKNAIADLKDPPCGDIDDINRLDALIDWANRCGDHEEVYRLATLLSEKEMKDFSAAQRRTAAGSAVAGVS